MGAILRPFTRSSILFAVGALFTLVLKLLQVQRSVPVALFPQELITALYNAWWILPVCGLASAIVGMLFPCLDEKFGGPHTFQREWSSVMRCIAVFIGIGHATAKVNYENNLQLSFALAVMSLGIWWLFDRSTSGFGLSVGISILATITIHLLLDHEVVKYTERDFLYVKSWLPYVFFSGGITVGTIGRQLAICDTAESKKHYD